MITIQCFRSLACSYLPYFFSIAPEKDCWPKAAKADAAFCAKAAFGYSTTNLKEIA